MTCEFVGVGGALTLPVLPTYCKVAKHLVGRTPNWLLV